MTREFHKCPRYGDEDNEYQVQMKLATRAEIKRLINQINLPALLGQASGLRSGMPCHFVRDLEHDWTGDDVMGARNYNIELEFKDGVRWMARFRRVNASSPPPDLRRHMMRNEVHTLQALTREFKIPTPKVHDYCLDSSNPVGMEYILMDKLPGKTLKLHEASIEQRRKVIKQLADVYIEIAKHPVTMLGAYDEDNIEGVGCFATDMMTDYVGSEMRPLGPFANRQEYAVAKTEFMIDLIMREEIYTEQAVDAFLIHRFLSDHAKSIFSSWRYPRHMRHLTTGLCFLRHTDDKENTILVDDDYNITGIIDWEMAQTDNICGAFKPPTMLLDKSFFQGSTDLSDDEYLLFEEYEDRDYYKKPCLEDALDYGHMVSFFDMCCGYQYPGWDGIYPLFHGLRKELNKDADLDWDSWKEKALVQYKDDSRLHELIKRHWIEVQT